MNNVSDSRKGLHYGYVIVAACSVILFVCVPFGLNAMGVLFTSISQGTGIAIGSVSLIITGVSSGMVVGLPVLGRFFDRIDVRIFTTGAVAIQAAGQLLLSVSSTLPMLVAGGFLEGFALSVLLHLMTSTLINRWFAKRAGTFIGVAMAFTGIGGIFWSMVIGVVVNSLGWQMAFRIEAVALLVLSLPFTLFVLRGHPSDKGLLPYGYEGERSDSVEVEASGVPAGKAFSSLAFAILLVVAFIANYGMYGHTMLASYVSSLPISAAAPLLAATLSAVALVGQTIGKISMGAIADRSPLICAAIGYVLGLVAIAGFLLLSDSTLGISVSAFLFGFFTVLTNVLMPVMTKAMFGTRDFVKIWSIVAMTGQIAGILQGPTLGTLIDSTGSYDPMYLILAATFVAGLIMTWMGLASAKRLRDRLGVSL